jgi:hypothetical protein
MNGFAAERADAIYRYGPETATASAVAVVTGRVVDLTRRITATTAGAPTAMTWTTEGRLVDLRPLKGPLPQGEIAIRRAEQAMFAMTPRAEPSWTLDYGELVEDGAAVAFLARTDPPEVTLVVPSGEGEQDLAGVAASAAKIASLKDPDARHGALLAWLAAGPTVPARQAAIRLLLGERVGWHEVRAALAKAWPSADPRARQFFVGAAGFAMVERIWPADDKGPVDFMCRAFLEAEPRWQPAFMLPLNHVLAWTDRDDVAPAEARLGSTIVACFRARQAAGPLGPELQPYFDQLDRRDHPR